MEIEKDMKNICECGHSKAKHRADYDGSDFFECILDDCPCVDYTKSATGKKIIRPPTPDPVILYTDQEEEEQEPVISTSTDVVRGNDELAFWLKQAKEGSDIEVTIAFSLHGLSKCPVCHTETDLFNYDRKTLRNIKKPTGYKEMMQHITIAHMQNYDREIGKAFHTKREYIQENNRIKLGEIVFDRFYTNYEMDILNKTIAMLQILIKFEANPIKNNPKQARKRAECMYRLSKEFLLTEKQIIALVNLAPGSHNRVYEILARGLDEYYGGVKNYPVWMQRVLAGSNK